MNPDEIQIEIPLQNERFLERQRDNTEKPSMRLLKVFVDEQSMMGYPTIGHISPEQYEIFKNEASIGVDDDGEETGQLIISVTKNPNFILKVVGKADHPGTDYYETPVEKGEEGEVYVPPVFDPRTGLPQDAPSVIKPTEAENKKEKEDAISEDA